MTTQKEMADHIDMSVRAIQDVLDKFEFPRKGFDKDKVRVRYIRHLREKAAGRYSGEQLDLAEERARLTFHQANIASLDERVKEGELVSVEEVEKYTRDMVLNCRAKLLSIPTKAAHEFVNLSDLSEIQDALKAHIHEALLELSNEFSKPSDKEGLS